MIARGLQRSVYATEDAGTCVLDLRHFSMPRCCANDFAAKGVEHVHPERDHDDGVNRHVEARNGKRLMGGLAAEQGDVALFQERHERRIEA